MRARQYISLNVLGALLLAPPAALCGATAEQNEFFESRIRPVLAQECYECHSEAGKAKGGLLLDSRPGWQAGGDSGAAIKPGDPTGSLLMQSIRHEHEDLKMPRNGAKLTDKVIADFAQWITMGAPDPRDKAPSAADLEKATSWEAVLQRRKIEAWCLQPIRVAAPPTVKNTGWSDQAIDRFILAKIEDAGLAPAAAADPATLVRRVTLVLTGLPPTPAEVSQYVQSAAHDPARAYAALVDRLLESPRFGERWARHWMDWMRYAETHGSEGDPAIPFAWRYRDYLIRALNADVPYPQLVREQIAGDLLPRPRVNTADGINESALGTGHYRMVLHGFTPTDPLDELATFTDNQIDVMSKAFMGLTVSCARCHNHKFDPISQTDFYALYGIFASCKPALIDVSLPSRTAAGRDGLVVLKQRIKSEIGAAWLKAAADLPKRLAAWKPEADARKKAENGGVGPLAAWLRLRGLEGSKFADEWKTLVELDHERSKNAETFAKSKPAMRWNAGENRPFWYTSGQAAEAKAGEFHVSCSGDTLIGNIFPAGFYSDLLSDKDRGVLLSPRFKSDGGSLWVRVSGGGGAMARYAVQNYPRRGTVYPKLALDADAPGWQSWDLDYFKGDSIHIELATEADMPVETKNSERSWFGITDAVYLPKDAPPPVERGASLVSLVGEGFKSPADAKDLAAAYAKVARETVQAWIAGKMSDEQAEFLCCLARHKLLPNDKSELPAVALLVDEYRRAEAGLNLPTRAPGVLEADGFDQPLFAQGDHKRPLEPVQRRFLDAVDPTPYTPKNSGRLELAESLTREDNPLFWRVIVNRLWHHVFGRGIVATTDNFGRLGEEPTHPELLDHLATQFRAQGGSIKSMLRLLVISKTFQMSDQPVPGARPLEIADPENKLLSHFPVRRLEAEAIRDSMLAVSGNLDETQYGEPVDGSTPRRSVYVRVIRNNLDPLLTVFDAPVPSSTRGRRDATNVPAQSLALLNNVEVIGWAQDWAKRILRDTTLASDEDRARRMFATALAREPEPDELKQSLKYVRDAAAGDEALRASLASLESEATALRMRIEEITGPVRQKLETAAGKNTENARGAAPAPYAEWDFEDGTQDLCERLPLELEGNARVANGALVLDGGVSFAKSPPLPVSLREKTLEAWVMLEDLKQAGGGVMNVQTLNGSVFDAMVFGEKSPGTWVAGSDHFNRTQDLVGEQEKDATDRPVHFALVYRGDGVVLAYRNGKPYGKEYQSGGPMEFKEGAANMLFGVRHGAPTGNKVLRGRIFRARLYDRALTPGEIARSSAIESGGVSEGDVLAALPLWRRQQYDDLAERLASLDRRLSDLRQMTGQVGGQETAWASLAQSLFNLKEFIYLR